MRTVQLCRMGRGLPTDCGILPSEGVIDPVCLKEGGGVCLLGGVYLPHGIRMTDTRLWYHYLPATSFASVKKSQVRNNQHGNNVILLKIITTVVTKGNGNHGRRKHQEKPCNQSRRLHNENKFMLLFSSGAKRSKQLQNWQRRKISCDIFVAIILEQNCEHFKYLS